MRRDKEQQLDAEVRFHFEEQVRHYVAQGMTEREARRRVCLEFGGIEQVKEDCRDQRRFRWLAALLAMAGPARRAATLDPVVALGQD